jgi:hypothetical protein
MHRCGGYISTEAKPNNSLDCAVYEISAKDLRFTFEGKVQKLQVFGLFGQYPRLLCRRCRIAASKQSLPVLKFDVSWSQTNAL